MKDFIDDDYVVEDDDVDYDQRDEVHMPKLGSTHRHDESLYDVDDDVLCACISSWTVSAVCPASVLWYRRLLRHVLAQGRKRLELPSICISFVQ